jgi:predicted glycogen debranching enzyme
LLRLRNGIPLVNIYASKFNWEAYRKIIGNMLPEWAPSLHLYNEFLETNGIGGYASATVAGAVSRRYHAFLCAATKAPQERRILVSKISETIIIGEKSYPLDANFWPNNVSPRGDKYLKEFAVDPISRWSYVIPTENGEVEIEKTLWMQRETNATIARYRKLRGPNLKLVIRPFVTGRDYHSTHHKSDEFNESISLKGNRISMRPYSYLPNIHFDCRGTFHPDAHWFYNFEWPIEIERGLDSHEDAFSPGTFEIEMKGTKPFHFCASTEGVALTKVEDLLLKTIETRRALGGGSDWDQTLNRLNRAADQFIVRREDGLYTVLAGYHWFTDWGRDTMIALPGLCLTTGRYDIAASILKAFAGAMSQGMIPNRFPDAVEKPDYNTVDGTLWLFHAVGEFFRASGDLETIQLLYPKLKESIEWHLAGTRFGIVADDEDGMLCAGDSNSQLTWMDAKIGDTAFTPRAGKPVEIQALWFNALCEMAILARRLGDDPMKEICLQWSHKIATHFSDKFWNESEECLYDFIDDSKGRTPHYDGAIRPNQIFVVSLPHRLLSLQREHKVVACVERELLTPHGLRSLSARDSRYRGIYMGDSWSRDSAYHQGTVWGWPIGAFLSAYLKVHNYSFEAKTQTKLWLQPLIEHLDCGVIGSVSEIFDGDAPHAPRGCGAQAWSVSEILRIWKKVA